MDKRIHWGIVLSHEQEASFLRAGVASAIAASAEELYPDFTIWEERLRVEASNSLIRNLMTHALTNSSNNPELSSACSASLEMDTAQLAGALQASEKIQHAFSLEGKVALVSGGGSGIGLAIAREMHSLGATVLLVGRREGPLKSAVERMGERASFACCDVADNDAVRGAADGFLNEFGKIDCLVNNAGIHVKKPAMEHDRDDFQAILDTHVIGAHALTAAVAPSMVSRKSGSIVFIASMASLFGIPHVLAYSAAKSAYLGMARTLATELSPNGVRVNVVAPGWIQTEMSGAALSGDPVRSQKILSRTPMARFGEVEEVGRAVAFLASPAASFITGAVLPVDGGASIGF